MDVTKRKKKSCAPAAGKKEPGYHEGRRKCRCLPGKGGERKITDHSQGKKKTLTIGREGERGSTPGRERRGGSE